MKRILSLFAFGFAMSAFVAFAQDDGGKGKRSPEGKGGNGGPPPLEKVLDANSDGVISAEEIANAPAALKKLDKNGDGKLAADEFRPPRPEDGEGENKDDEK